MTIETTTPSAGLWNEKQAADFYGICVRTLQKLRKAGEIPYVRFGRRVLFDPADVPLVIQRFRVPPANCA